MAGVAYAVVRDDPPQVFLAESVEVLERVLVLELVARTETSELAADRVAYLRKALLEERWADAVVEWIETTGTPVDVYTHLHIYTEQEHSKELIGAQLQFSPLFRDR